jgi:hypothetical protein
VRLVNVALLCQAPPLSLEYCRAPVPPEAVYFRCNPRFETASASLAWITERLFLGTGARHPDKVVMRFFEVA